MKTISDNRLNSEIETFNSSLIPFGYLDIKEAVKTALEGGYDGSWLADRITEFMEDTDTKLEDIDPNYVAYDSLFQEARNNIIELTDIDILNDTRDQVYVYGNYMCTSFDYSEEALEELLEIISGISEEDLTDPIRWLKGELG